MKFAVAGLLLLTCVFTAESQTVSPTAAYLREHPLTPVNYVLSKAASPRITILGEASGSSRTSIYELGYT